MSDPWTLLGVSMVGTDRAGWPPLSGLPPALGPLYNDLIKRPPELGLLIVAGIWDRYATAGQLPAKANATEWRLPAYRPDSDLLPCSPAATRWFERMLNNQHTDLLPEFLALLAQHRRRIPDELLPHVLEHGARVRHLRSAILPVLGEKGRWLASMNPKWVYGTVDPLNGANARYAWNTDVAGRGVLVEILRLHNPETARQLLESTWRDEPDKARVEQIRGLKIGLSMNDEPFLERALDDRDAQVRRRAVELLAQLAESRLIKRVIRVAGNWLMWRDEILVPRIPGSFNDQLVRDGVQRLTTGQLSANEITRLILQTVGIIPPNYWESRFQKTPEQLVEAARNSQWPRTLITAFTSAALRHQDQAWARALLVGDGFSERTGLVLPLLSPSECYNHLEQQVEAGNDPAVVVFLRRWSSAWDVQSGRLLIRYLINQATHNTETRFGPTFRYLSRQFAHQCPPELVGEAADMLQQCLLDGQPLNPLWEPAINALIAKLIFRSEMHKVVNAT